METQSFYYQQLGVTSPQAAHHHAVNDMEGRQGATPGYVIEDGSG
jgi:hypothetical protein